MVNNQLLNMDEAAFSPDRLYRYMLLRQWAFGNIPPIVWIGLNPSTADEFKNDNTITRCTRFSMYMGGTRMVMLNLFAYRSVNPGIMKSQLDPIGSDNDFYIKHWMGGGAKIIVCWGADGAFLDRDRKVYEMIKPLCGKLYCLGTTNDGFPRHPSRLGYDTEVVEYEGRW